MVHLTSKTASSLALQGDTDLGRSLDSEKGIDLAASHKPPPSPCCRPFVLSKQALPLETKRI